MPLYALPLAASSTTQHSKPSSSRVQFSSLPVRKRKRVQNDSDNESISSLPELVQESNAAAAFTNPLSLTPAEIVQYKLAGLQLNEELPSIGVKDFPHRGLPEHPLPLGDRKEKEKLREEDELVDTDNLKEKNRIDRETRGPKLRLQHLSVLTAILQRCLQEGDIPRATRAWSMLLRMQVAGQGIDYRGSGYWGIGAELLIRNLEKKGKKFAYDSDSNGSEDDASENAEGNKLGRAWNWGSKEGLEMAKEYYERLILQHPYKRQFDTSISALDFWPAMVGCEIYGIDSERRSGLKRIEIEEKNGEEGRRSADHSEASSSEEDANSEISSAYVGFAADQRRKAGKMKRRRERRWIQRDNIRQTALLASEKISTRLDELMVTPPYSDSHNLLRLRGMLALYIGSLSVPEKPIKDREEDWDEKNETQARSSQATEHRLLWRQRLNEHEQGKAKRKEQRESARKLFDRIIREGGSADGINMSPLDNDEDQDDDTTDYYDAEE